MRYWIYLAVIVVAIIAGGFIDGSAQGSTLRADTLEALHDDDPEVFAAMVERVNALTHLAAETDLLRTRLHNLEHHIETLPTPADCARGDANCAPYAGRVIIDFIGETIEVDYLEAIAASANCWEDEAVVVVISNYAGGEPFAADHATAECAPYDDLSAGQRP